MWRPLDPKMLHYTAALSMETTTAVGLLFPGSGSQESERPVTSASSVVKKCARERASIRRLHFIPRSRAQGYSNSMRDERAQEREYVPHTDAAAATACVYRGMFCMLYVPGGVLVSALFFAESLTASETHMEKVNKK